MSIWNVVGKIPIIVFSVFMAALYINGLLDPVGTNYWIAREGIIIMILEFCSLFAASVAISLGSNEGGILPWLPILAIFPLAFFFAAHYNLWLFVYFSASTLAKTFTIIKSYEIGDGNKASRFAGVSILSLLLSVFIGIGLSKLLSGYFAENLNLIYEFHNSFTSAEAVIEIFVFWGITYFVMLPIMDIASTYYENKTGKPFVKTIPNKHAPTHKW